MIGIAMTFFGKKFSFISNLYFMRYMYAKTKNAMLVPRIFLFLTFLLTVIFLLLNQVSKYSIS